MCASMMALWYSPSADVLRTVCGDVRRDCHAEHVLSNTHVSFAHTSGTLNRENLIDARGPAATAMANSFPDVPTSSFGGGHESGWDTGPLPLIRITLNAAPPEQTPLGSEGGVPSTTHTANEMPGSPPTLLTSTPDKFPSSSTNLPGPTPGWDTGRYTTLLTIPTSSMPSATISSTGTTPSSSLAGISWIPGEACTYGTLNDLRPGTPPLFIAIAGIAVSWSLFFAWAVWHLWQSDDKNVGRRGHSHYRGPMELSVLRNFEKQKSGGHQAVATRTKNVIGLVSHDADETQETRPL